MSSVPSLQTTTATSHDDSMSHAPGLPRTQRNAPLSHLEADTTAPAPPLSRPGPQNHGDVSKPSSAAREARLKLTTALHLSVEVPAPILATPARAHHRSFGGNDSLSPSRAQTHNASTNNPPLLSRSPSLKSALANSIGPAMGSIPSPVIAAMGDMTPLPSPLLSSDSPGPWKMLNTGSASPPQSRKRLSSMGEVSGLGIESAVASPQRRRTYVALDEANNAPPPRVSRDQQQPHHAKSRSISEYIPDPVAVPRRPVAVSASHFNTEAAETHETQMRREMNFAQSRGLTPTVTQPPTPPPSESSKNSTDGRNPKGQSHEHFDARARGDQKIRRWRSIAFIGQGTFSRVMLATSQTVPDSDPGEPGAGGPVTPVAESKVDRKKLVAVKVCEHGPRGGASEERVEMSLKRELEIMQDIHHPSLVNLKAWSIEPTRAILVLSYSPGGDLFDVATAHRKILAPALLRRMFAELVGAIRYLHQRGIVHRDVKLENVLVNYSPAELADPSVDWAAFPHSVTTLTDLGLSRRVADGEMLETRCGSDDYAAPEVIMGQPYDGRATDAWSLGVLLYALLEARLPFDPHPGMSDAHRMRSRTSHRIARVEWRWIEYAGDDGEHEADAARFGERGLVGAMETTEGLLKRARSRWSVANVAAQPWVRDAIQADGGLQFREEEEGAEV